MTRSRKADLRKVDAATIERMTKELATSNEGLVNLDATKRHLLREFDRLARKLGDISAHVAAQPSDLRDYVEGDGSPHCVWWAGLDRLVWTEESAQRAKCKPAPAADQARIAELEATAQREKAARKDVK